ncbi:MAG TPA: hypothetical protein VFQ53_23095 [Kofleriaceae bacterium]|nr:hypothetical protein [Kofleriaceae bacterium]
MTIVWLAATIVVGLGIAYLLARRPDRALPAPRASQPVLAHRQLVTVTGTVQLRGEPLITPLSARRCVLFEAYANLYDTKPGDAEAPRVLVAQLARRAMVPFVLESAAGTIVVDGVEADLELLPTPVLPRRPEREAAFLRDHDRAPELAETAQFEEISIDPDSLVSVRGLLLVEDGGMRLVAHGEQLPLLIGTPRRVPMIVHDG